MIINIFIPENFKECTNGYLCGEFLSAANDKGDGAEISTVVISSVVEESESNKSIGVINPDINVVTSDIREKTQPVWIVLRTIPVLMVFNMWLNWDSVNTKDINIIYYSSLDISHSVLLNNKKDSTCSQCSVNFFLLTIKEKWKEDGANDRSVNYYFIFVVSKCCLNLSSFVKKFCCRFNNFLTKTFSVESSFVQQVILRCTHIENLLETSNRSRDLIVIRILGVILTDVLLGVLFLYVFYTETLAYELHLGFQVTTKVLASNVQILLDWLRGAPAGLKLNQPLAESLSYFFLYHVYLWTIYIDVASSVLFILAHLFVYCGVFGLSFQIALMRDFLNLSVLHIHCFYIYAARLHMVQVSLFGSQWRGFRGFKWNPLKQRVDARSEVRSRPVIKILSAVGFTFVVFLFPTTTVFYAVFVLLRLILLTLQGVASLLLWVINSNPVSIFWLHFFNSSCVKGELHFEVESSLENHFGNPLTLRLSIRSSPFGKVIAASHDDYIFTPVPAPKLTKIFRSLVYAKKLL